MRYIKYFILVICFYSFLECAPLSKSVSTEDEHATAIFYETLFEGKEPNVAMLNLFLTQMPKGGDLHHHYSGSIYAETYLEWVKAKNLLIDTCSFKIVKESGASKCKVVTVDQLVADEVSYRKLLSLWSDKDFSNHSHEQLPPDSNFFNTFGYFSPISDQYMDIGLKLIKERAISENVSYVESMLSRVGIKSSEYFSIDDAKILNENLRKATSQEEVNALLERISTIISNIPSFETKVQAFVSELERLHQGIDDTGFTMRYQTYAVRVLDPLQVYTDLFSAYMAALKSPLIVGVNIVAPENNTVALNDYTLHMRMFHYLSNKYPQVHRSLHAGELTLGMVKPEDLSFHIFEAIHIAKAERIGHGVDLPYEQNAIALLEELKNHAAIEINFTSNQFILGVFGNAHPYTIYSKYGVPLVISTDDSGVSRNNLTHEYMLLSSRYHPSYKTIKKYVYNSIDYSFLSVLEKEKLKAQVDAKFTVFEHEIKALSKNLNR